ncbi:MAG TPA: hypothetical protein VK213_05780 [Bacteroidales bacterium]|nr:hypothetical protein [Bacteroidales bacterium]
MKRIFIVLFWLIITIGFALKIYSLFYMGIFDMEVYQEWGLNTLTKGLAGSYMGVYFPFQYQVFEFGSWLSQVLNIEYYIAYKLVNLAFDIGNLVVLFLILRKLSLSPFYLLIYWIHPWFLNMFSLGYIDFQFTFFILLMVLYSFKDTSRDYLIAGIFLGFAFLMKPQVQIILLTLFIFASIRYFRARDIRLFHIFIFPVVLFLNYTLYFSITDGNPLRLANVYINIANHMPCLNANCTNFWFPAAYYIKDADAPIYSVSDEITFIGIKVRYFAVLAVLSLIYIFSRKMEKNENIKMPDNPVLLLTCFSALVVPFLMTSAHENHMFLGTVLLIPVMGLTRSLIFKLCTHLLLIIQFINLYGYYHLGEIQNLNLPAYNYPYSIALIYSYIAVFIFIIMLMHFLRKFKSQ